MRKPAQRLLFIATIIIAHSLAQAADTRLAANSIDVQSEAFKNLRDPFWPVSYKPASESQKIEDTKIADLKAKISWPPLPLRGVTHAGGRNYIAIIEGVGLVEAGDFVEIVQDSLIYRWRIDKVSGTGVSSTRLDVTEKIRN
jgi:hypothetical protein